MKLVYVGPDPVEVGLVPLPEGWPAAPHQEDDAAIAEAKLASGMYREEGRKAKSDED